jgi:microsomal epoxide hydrolase
MPAHGYSIDWRAQDLHEFATAHAPVIVVGWSLAALETLQAIHLFGSDPFAGVVLVDSSVGEDPPPPAGPGPSFAERLRADRASALEAFVRAIFRQPPAAREVRALVDGALRLALEDSLSLFPGAIPREHWRTIVRALTLPLLYVVTPQFAEQAANLRAQRAGTRVEVFHASGHALFVDQPERFNRLLVQFARGIESRR